ncbi:MAG: hypothetical protein H6988_00200 [Pseudomonadales bacterium]|nr:hypothetical protein [Pseudomonadales bacterium]MCP5520980.1 hypothetical protein [Verrucomicrobiales bacterium]
MNTHKLLIVGVACIAMPLTVKATPTGVAFFEEIGSWQLTGIYESQGKPYSCLEAFIVGGVSTFEDPGWGSPLKGDWTSELINPLYAKTSGSPLDNQWLSLKFSGAMGQMVTWDVLVWQDENTLLQRYEMWANGYTWGWKPLSTDAGEAIYDRSAVPDSGLSAGLLGLGLLSLGFGRSRQGIRR